MSWDLDFVPEGRAGDASEWLGETADVAPDPVLAGRHADAILRRFPSFERVDRDDGSVGLSFLDAEASLPVTVSLDGHGAGLSVAYWDLAGREDEVTAAITGVAEVLAEVADLVAFDPQQDRVVPPEGLRAAFLVGHRGGYAAAERVGAQIGVAPGRANSSGRGSWWTTPTLGKGFLAAGLLIAVARWLGLLG